MEKLKVLIGRSSQCDYTIENPEQHGTVSGKHATISETDSPDTFLLEDHSTNGSYVNGQLVHKNSCIINVSDHITLGKTYVLPLADIVKRYFSSSKTTKKVPQPKADDSMRTMPATDATVLSGHGTKLLPQDNDEHYHSFVPQEESDRERVIEKVPVWYWWVLAVSRVVAFGAGVCVSLLFL